MDKLVINLVSGEVSFHMGLDAVTLISLDVVDRFQVWSYNDRSEWVMIREDVSGSEAYDIIRERLSLA